MVTATNVDATAVNTIDWLSTADVTIVVPVYQRQYRWDIGACEQLLADIRAVADLNDRHMHFIGSILSSDRADGEGAELVLIDGQQRITTLMLLVAALHHTLMAEDSEVTPQLQRVLVASHDPERTKLRPHRAWAEVFERVVLAPGGATGARDSRFDDNYAFFRSQISLDEAPRIWRGLQKLEHVAITLGSGANAQQIFESLNSTGEPLRDHELIHNYVLMGLSHAEQREIEADFWLPIELNTGDAIAEFWRHYLIMATGREITGGAGGRGVYDAFRHTFPRLEIDDLRAHAARWRAHAEIYRVLRDPSAAPDAEIGRQLGYVNTFGSGLYPLVMRAYDDFLRGVIDREELIETLEMVQALLMRRAIVGTSTDRLVARLCRAREEGADALAHAIGRITPSDERVRVALKYSDLPHPVYVLGRLAGVSDTHGFEVDHIVPLTPGESWSGDGTREWAEYTEDEQNSHRALAQTLGNLALLEQELAERVFDRSFPAKRAAFARSAVASTRDLADLGEWSTRAIAERSSALSDRFVQVWARPGSPGIDDDGLTPVLDAVRRRGWPPGWEREWDYVEYRGEHWEVPDVKYLFNRVFKRLWADSRTDVVSYSERRGGPVYEARSWNGQWDQLDDDHFLYMGWDSSYMLSAVQGVLEEAGLAPEVFVKYSYIGAVM
ncbi:hypothetical protein ASD56_09300 [Microbacterium sp. Root166]|nr:hypothetical protein ASD56_09300 [Microbacterium sp. Root166]